MVVRTNDLTILIAARNLRLDALFVMCNKHCEVADSIQIVTCSHCITPSKSCQKKIEQTTRLLR